MGRVKKRALLKISEREALTKKAIKAFEFGKFPSIRKAAEAHGIGYTTLHRRLNGGLSRVLAHAGQQLLSPAKERAIVRWIVKMEEFGFPPRIEHVKEAVILLKGDWDEEVGKNWITRFLNRHPNLVSKFSTQFDKKKAES